MPILADASKRVAIWGFGREGRAAFDEFRATWPDRPIAILNDTPVGDADLQGANITLVVGQDALAAICEGRFDIVIRSPGISLRLPEIAVAKEAGVQFTSGTNLWFEENSAAKTIVVTGTKGKSSTARLLHHILTTSGLDTALLGNVGIPALGHKAGRDYTVLELSSYQIADLAFAPTIAVVTNLFPEHAPWHGGVEQYFRDKLRILSLNDATVGVCNFESPRLKERVGNRNAVLWFNREDGFRARDGHLFYRRDKIALSGFPLKGAHNLDNLAAACTVADFLGLDMRHSLNLSGFSQLPHRLEEFEIGGGVLGVNDSLSTVPEATIAALKAYAGRPVVLFLGGHERGQDYSELIAFLGRSRVKSIYLLPANGARIFSEMAIARLDIPVHLMSGLDAAILPAMRDATNGDVLLLSPAAPSFGDFKNFEERGECFKQLCRAFRAG